MLISWHISLFPETFLDHFDSNGKSASTTPKTVFEFDVKSLANVHDRGRTLWVAANKTQKNKLSPFSNAVIIMNKINLYLNLLPFGFYPFDISGFYFWY